MAEMTEAYFRARVTVSDSGCWEWAMSRFRSGYGQLHIKEGGKNRSCLAHRIAYETMKGPIPEGLFVMHGCDNPCCVNPDHLSIGTATENMRDMVRRGRAPFGDKNGARKYPEKMQRGDAHYTRRQPESVRRGSQHHNVKLNEDTVREIKRRLLSGEKQAAIASDYGVVREAVSSIKQGRTWAHV